MRSPSLLLVWLIAGLSLLHQVSAFSTWTSVLDRNTSPRVRSSELLHAPSDSSRESEFLSPAGGSDRYHTLPRLYVGAESASSPISLNIRLRLTPDQAHYVTKVMRVGVGSTEGRHPKDLIRVFDGLTGEWLGRVAMLHDDDEPGINRPSRRRSRRREASMVEVLCIEQLCAPPPASQSGRGEPWLFFAPIKKARVKMLLEKAVELGVGRLVPILTERCDPGAVRDCCRDLEKLQPHIVEASEQCERLSMPTLSFRLSSTTDETEEPIELQELLQTWTTTDSDVIGNRHLLVCRERSESDCAPVLQVLGSVVDRDDSVAFLVGPEGGWSAREQVLLDQYVQSCDRIHAVSLGRLVLRAETAATTALAAYMMFRDASFHERAKRDKLEY